MQQGDDEPLRECTAWFNHELDPNLEKGIIFPNLDPMVIREDIFDFDVGRLLIDIRSTVNVLFIDAFEMLEIVNRHINRSITHLLSFFGDVVHSFDSIMLPLAVGTTPKKAFLYTTFLVVDCPITYNVIIGRLALTKMKAFLAPHMLMMKFPTRFGVG